MAADDGTTTSNELVDQIVAFLEKYIDEEKLQAELTKITSFSLRGDAVSVGIEMDSLIGFIYNIIDVNEFQIAPPEPVYDAEGKLVVEIDPVTNQPKVYDLDPTTTLGEFTTYVIDKVFEELFGYLTIYNELRADYGDLLTFLTGVTLPDLSFLGTTAEEMEAAARTALVDLFAGSGFLDPEIPATEIPATENTEAVYIEAVYTEDSVIERLLNISIDLAATFSHIPAAGTEKSAALVELDGFFTIGSGEAVKDAEGAAVLDDAGKPLLYLTTIRVSTDTKIFEDAKEITPIVDEDDETKLLAVHLEDIPGLIPSL
jgi:hypothetical protein